MRSQKKNYRLKVRQAMSGSKSTPKKNLPKLQTTQKFMIGFLNKAGAKPKAAAQMVKFANRKPDNRYL